MQMAQGSQNRRQGNYFQLLPEEITIEILSRLPLSNVFQARSVCNSWRNIIWFSPNFHKLWDEKNSEQWLFMDDRQGGVEILNPSGEFKMKIFESSSWLLKAACGGLLLYQHKTEGLLQVVNPLTMEVRQLPNAIMGEEGYPLISFIDLIVDSTAKTYQVIGVTSDMEILIYRSATSSWETKRVTNRCATLAPYNLKELAENKEIIAALWSPPFGRRFLVFSEFDEPSYQWKVEFFCRLNSKSVTFGELLYEKDHVMTCIGGTKAGLWMESAFTDEEITQINLMLQQQKPIFSGHNPDDATTFPMRLRFSLRP